PDGVRRPGRPRTAANAGIGRGCRADASVLPGAAHRPRHGRIRPNRFVSAIVHRRASDHLHSHLRPLTRVPSGRTASNVGAASARVVVLTAALIGAGAAGEWAWLRRDRASDRSRLTLVATAHQLGPVGYRDPAGAISPDGRWVAYSEGRFL